MTESESYDKELDEWMFKVLERMHDDEEFWLGLINKIAQDELSIFNVEVALKDNEELESQYYRLANEVTANVLARAIVNNRFFPKRKEVT